MTITLLNTSTQVTTSGPSFELSSTRYDLRDEDTGRLYSVSNHGIVKRAPSQPLLGEPFALDANLGSDGTYYVAAFGLVLPGPSTMTINAIDSLTGQPRQIVSQKPDAVPAGTLLLGPYPTVLGRNLDEVFHAMDRALYAASRGADTPLIVNYLSLPILVDIALMRANRPQS